MSTPPQGACRRADQAPAAKGILDLLWRGIGKGRGLTGRVGISLGKRAFATDTKPTRTDATLRAYVKGGFLLLARAQDKMTGPGGDVIDAFPCLCSRILT